MGALFLSVLERRYPRYTPYAMIKSSIFTDKNSEKDYKSLQSIDAHSSIGH
jgi:hypothetical protein